MKIIGLVAVMALSSGLGNAGEVIQERRNQILEKYDKNGNGRLDASERESLRNDRKKVLEPRPENRGGGGGRQQEKHPPELLKKYDKDKSGWIDGKEWDIAGPAESAIIKKKYDTDGDDVLSDKEKEGIWADIRSQKLKGVYAGIAHHFFLRQNQRKEPQYITRQKALLEFDKDGDGIASRSELAAIRKSRQEKGESK